MDFLEGGEIDYQGQVKLRNLNFHRAELSRNKVFSTWKFHGPRLGWPGLTVEIASGLSVPYKQASTHSTARSLFSMKTTCSCSVANPSTFLHVYICS